MKHIQQVDKRNVIGGPRCGETWKPGDHHKQIMRLQGHRYAWHEKSQRWIHIGREVFK